MRAARLGIALIAAGLVAVLIGILSRPGPGRALPHSFGRPDAVLSGPVGGAGPAPSDGTSSSVVARAVRPAAPVALSIPKLHVRAEVKAVSAVDAELDVPDDPQQVGWWEASALAGSPAGRTVLDGHVDSARRGLGALFHLDRLQHGDLLRLVARSGTVYRYRVYARQVLSKSGGHVRQVFTVGATPGLVVVTCGGPFDRQTGNYADNIAVYAALQP